MMTRAYEGWAVVARTIHIFVVVCDAVGMGNSQGSCQLHMMQRKEGSREVRQKWILTPCMALGLSFLSTYVL